MMNFTLRGILSVAVDSGEFFSAEEPDPYDEPEVWVQGPNGIEARPAKYEPKLISPRGALEARR